MQEIYMWRLFYDTLGDSLDIYKLKGKAKNKAGRR